MTPSANAAIMTGIIASPSKPSVKLTAFAAPTTTIIENGINNNPRWINVSLKTGNASLYWRASG